MAPRFKKKNFVGAGEGGGIPPDPPSELPRFAQSILATLGRAPQIITLQFNSETWQACI